MGAAGGVCYVPMRDPSKRARALGLLRPFYGLFYCPWKRGCAAEQTSAWEEAHPEIASSENYLMGYYGDFGFSTDLGDLADMFKYYHNLDEIIPDPSLTFEELLEDMITRPSWHGPWDQTPIEKILWEFFGWRVQDIISGMPILTGDREYRDVSMVDFAPIRDMKVVEWAKEVEQLCRWGSCDREETWT